MQPTLLPPDPDMSSPNLHSKNGPAAAFLALVACSAQALASESSVPLAATAALGDKPAASRLTIEPENVLATALKPSDDGRAIIVRLYGASSKLPG